MNIHREGPLANSISLYLSHKHALGKRMEKPESVLRLLDKYLVEQKVEDLNQISQVHLEGFSVLVPDVVGAVTTSYSA